MGEVSHHVYYNAFGHCVVFTKCVLTAGSSGATSSAICMACSPGTYSASAGTLASAMPVLEERWWVNFSGPCGWKEAGGEFQPVLVGKAGWFSLKRTEARFSSQVHDSDIYFSHSAYAQACRLGGHLRLDSIDPKVKLLKSILSPKLS